MAVKTLNNYGEQLLSNLGKTGAIGLDGTFTARPTCTVSELRDTNYNVRSGHEYVIARFEIQGIFSLPQNVSKILVYNELTFSESPLPSGLRELQTKNLFTQLNILVANNKIVFDRPIHLSVDINNIYNFYIIFIDHNDNVINVGNNPLILYVANVLFTGLSNDELLFHCKDLRTENIDILDDSDIDGTGFINNYTFRGTDVKLVWFDLKSIASEADQAKYENANVFADTFGNLYRLDYKDFSRIDYYVLYGFYSKNGLKPETRYPQQISPKVSLTPRVRDKNGSWKLIGQYQENRATVTINENEIVGFWVGFKLKK